MIVIDDTVSQVLASAKYPRCKPYVYRGLYRDAWLSQRPGIVICVRRYAPRAAYASWSALLKRLARAA